MPAKVFAAVPCAELARYPDFWQMLFQQQPPPGTSIRLGNCKGTYIYEQQNFLVRAFLQTDDDYFWLLNDDTRMPPDTLARLISCDKDIVVPLCLYKVPPFTPILYERDEGPYDDLQRRYLSDTDPRLISVAAAGGGGMLIKRKVLEKIPDPWFTVKPANPKPGDPAGTIGEDIMFCRHAWAAGFEIWCDTECRMGHDATFTVWPNRDPVTGKWATALVRSDQAFMVGAAAAVQSVNQGAT